MTSRAKPPVMTHQPGLPADSASCENPGSSPKPLVHNPPSPHDTLVVCHANNGPIPYIGDLVWTWLIIAGRWQVHTVIGQKEHFLGGPEYEILSSETGEARWMRYNKLYMAKES